MSRSAVDYTGQGLVVLYLLVVAFAFQFRFVSSVESNLTGVFCEDGRKLSDSVCLAAGYQKSSIPKSALANGMTVWTIFNVSNIHTNDIDRTIRVELSIEISWSDDRIKVDGYHEDFQLLDYTVLDSSQINAIWNPDVSIYHVVDFQRISILNPTNGYLSMIQLDYYYYYYVDYLFTGHATIDCDFNFDNYPMDRQSCEFRLISLSYGEYLTFLFYNTMRLEANSTIPNSEFDMKIHFFDRDLCRKAGNAMIEVACHKNLRELGFIITMERYLQPFVMRYYLPSVAIVLISQTSFFVPPNVIPGRAGLLVTLFLTQTNIFMNQQVCVKYNINTTMTYMISRL